MICFVPISGVVLFVIIILIISLVGTAHVIMMFNANMIMLIIIFVVISIFTFMGYYIGGDVSNENFKLLKVLFLRLMVLILVSYGVVIFVR